MTNFSLLFFKIFLYSGPFKEAVHINFCDFPDRNGSKYQKVPQVIVEEPCYCSTAEELLENILLTLLSSILL
jgi:hypothetical protein